MNRSRKPKVKLTATTGSLVRVRCSDGCVEVGTVCNHVSEISNGRSTMYLIPFNGLYLISYNHDNNK